jgi:hypothetical protein
MLRRPQVSSSMRLRICAPFLLRPAGRFGFVQASKIFAMRCIQLYAEGRSRDIELRHWNFKKSKRKKAGIVRKRSVLWDGKTGAP